MILKYYYSNTCGCCKNYISVVKRISDEYNFQLEEIDYNKEKNINIIGLPTVILYDDNNVEIYRHSGNLPYKFFKNNIKELDQK